MTRTIRGLVLLAACVGLWSCSSDPTADEAGKPFKIVSLPSVVFVQQDSSELVVFQLVDELDGQIPESWTITGIGANITVGLDSSYRPVYLPDGDSTVLTLPDKQTEVRATITGLALGLGTFTVSAGGKTLTIPVNVVPGSLHAVFAPANPAPGDVVTMTVPPTLRLTPTSAITFTGNLNPVSLTIAADSQSATFIPAPTTAARATVTGVFNTEFPTVPPATYTTQDSLIGTMSGQWNGKLPGTISDLTPTGPPIDVTLNAGFAFKSTAPASVFAFPSQTAPIVNSISADSSVANLSVGPNVASLLQVTRITFKGAPQFEYTVLSADSVYSPVIANFPASLSVANPQIAQTTVLTAGAGYTFNATATPTWGSNVAVVLSRTASTLTVQPVPGSSGSPTVTGLIAAAAPAFTLTLPSVLTVPLAMQATVAPGLAGTDASATAPLIAFAPTATGIIDGPDWAGTQCGYECAWYQITVPAAGPRTFALTWSNNTDLGLYFYNSALVGLGGGGCDAHGNGGSAQPETCTVNFPAAGTYYLDVENFGVFYGPDPNPTWVRIAW